MTEASQSGRSGTAEDEAGPSPVDDETAEASTEKASDPPARTAEPADTTAEPSETTAEPTETTDTDDALADQEDRAYRRELRKGLLLGVGGGVLVGLIVSLVLGALVWPGYLLSPGSPDDVAARVTAAFTAKDASALSALTCQGPDGPTSRIPDSALQVVSQATQPGPMRTTLDTEARGPLDLVISEQGQTQSLPSDMILAVNDGSWCLNGLAQRQQ